MFVDWSSVQIILERLNRLARQHLTQEGASVSKCEFSEFVTKRRIVGPRFSLVIVFNLKNGLFSKNKFNKTMLRFQMGTNGML